MEYEKPSIEDFGSITRHTFMPTPGGSHKGFPDPCNTDGMNEISHSPTGSCPGD
jgi:hypothetical protein